MWAGKAHSKYPWLSIFDFLKTAKVDRWTSDGDSENDSGDKDYRFTDDLEQANIISSWVRGTTRSRRMHKVVLDIDHSAALLESSTPGHYHLYIDVEIPDEEYWEMLDKMAAAGVLQQGYVSASKNRGFSALRLPWVKKDDPAHKMPGY